jgi:hypothetical protein
MTVTVYAPTVQVRLIKLVGRDSKGIAQHFAGAQSVIDLTPLFGDGGTIRTTKSLREDAGGFSLTFSDRMDVATQDTVYSLIEPMDMIEIRATRQPQLYVGADLPLIMRGFVSSVRRPESMSNDGAPSRLVVVQGQDSAKLWLIHAIWWQVATLQEKPMLNTFQFNAATGLQAKIYGLSDFMTKMTTDVMNPKVADMAAYSAHGLKPFTVNATVKRGCVIPQMTASYQGSMWGVMKQFAEIPWNELFIEDTEAGPVVNFREAPFKGIDGKFIMQDAIDPGTIPLDFIDVVSWDVARSDANVANFFWVPPGASSLATNSVLSADSLVTGQPLDFHYGNNDPTLYGEKRAEASTRAVPTDLDMLPSQAPAAKRPGENQKYVEWHLQRMADLKAMNRDNCVFEEGSAVVRGDEAWKMGRYLSVTRGSLLWQGYLTSVSHTIMPMVTWTSNLRVDRGTGFLERLKAPFSPYLAEGRPGPYSNP